MANLTAKDQFEARAELVGQGVRGVILINGGAAVSLLAFLQAIWPDKTGLAAFVVKAIGTFSVGVLVGAAANFLRYHTSLHFQAGHRARYHLYRTLTITSWYVPLVCFAYGMWVVLRGAQAILAFP